MAANVISNALRTPLYRIDLSQVVDKYIGETEKRLEEIFSYAQNTNVILFFDEADAIFGKRTEVTEAKDKYANTEVSFILQRIEEYNGIVILTSNMKNNIDTAYMRRMKYVVHFEMPDEDTRCEILKSSFSAGVPIKDLDLRFIAERAELSGGHLKNIVLNAVFLAAARKSPVTMEDMVRSLIAEYEKIGKVASFLDYIDQTNYVDYTALTEKEQLCALVDAAATADRAALRDATEKIMEIERRNAETAKRLLERED